MTRYDPIRGPLSAEQFREYLDAHLPAQITYRGWEIDRYRKPDGCFYAFAPDYDGLTPDDTQCASHLHELCNQIDEVIAERALAAAAREGGDVKQAPGEAPQSGGDSRNAQGTQP